MMSILLNHDNDNYDQLPIIHNQNIHDQETHHCNHNHDDHRNHYNDDQLPIIHDQDNHHRNHHNHDHDDHHDNDDSDQLPIIHDGCALQAVRPDKDTGDQGLTSAKRKIMMMMVLITIMKVMVMITIMKVMVMITMMMMIPARRRVESGVEGRGKSYYGAAHPDQCYRGPEGPV